ncbi:MAG: SixA phosphatase family protein [Acidimicrobiia bacterium]
MKQLLVMRHAKSDWHAGGTADHDRPLNRRGVESARIMGGVLTRAGLEPDLVVTSSAVRAHTTAQLVAEAGGWSASIVTDDRLYDSHVDGILAVIGETDEPVGRLMVVGHQPTWGALVARLTGASAAMRTASVAVIDLMLGTSWRHGGELGGELVALLQPRHFSDQ